MIRNVLFLFLLFFHLQYVFSHELATLHITEKCASSSIFKVFTEQVDSIEYADDEKVYLKPTNISYANTGFMLCNDQSSIFLPRLSIDENGYYLSGRSEDDVKLICSNPKCGKKWWYSKERTIYCPRCGHIGS